MSIELKIKQKSLAAEARIIREQEERLSDKAFMKTANLHPSLEQTIGLEAYTKLKEKAERGRHRLLAQRDHIARHRRNEVRTESRLTHLARGFIKGLPYQAMEAIVHDGRQLKPKHWERIEAMVLRYGPYTEGRYDPRGVKQRFEEWKQAADSWLNPSFAPDVIGSRPISPAT